MFVLYSYFVDFYNDIINDKADPRFKDYFLFPSPFPVIGIILFYNYFSFKLGPQLMQPMKPFNPKKFMILYNLLQIVLNFYLFCQAVAIAYVPLRYNLLCQEVDYEEEVAPGKVGHCALIYFWIKLLDLVDTVIMVLRKKHNQISFLHVYHHSAMILAGWWAVNFVAGGHSLFIGTLNCLVHAVMYFYYLLSILSPEYRSSLWWKKHLTELQMVQFLLMAVHSGVAILNPSCNYPKVPMVLFLIQNLFVCAMFWDFYKKHYFSRQKIQND